MEAGTHLLLDLRQSWEHRAGHPAGAVWTIRPRLASVLTGHGSAVVLLADDTDVAELAAIDLAELSAPSPV